MRDVLKGRAGAAAIADEPVRPSLLATIFTGVLVAIGVLLALLFDQGDEFKPRVDTLDALAGLVIGAFIVDRLLTFVPPIGAYSAADEEEIETTRTARVKRRATDIAFLRVGYGTLLGGLFVMVTDLRAIKVLSPEGATETVHAGLDRAIAALAIAGGVAGLSSLLAGLNPQPATDPKEGSDDPPPPEPAAAAETVPPPTGSAYVVGIVAVVIAALIAVLGAGDETGLELIGTSPQADGSIALIVRFGTVILLAGIIEQVVERLVAPFVRAKENKALVTGAVSLILGVAAARVIDLFLLHDLGFFGVGADETINKGLADSSGLERWFDTFLTGAIIAAGTKPLHDLSSGIKKRAKETPKTKAAEVPPPVVRQP